MPRIAYIYMAAKKNMATCAQSAGHPVFHGADALGGVVAKQLESLVEVTCMEI